MANMRNVAFIGTGIMGAPIAGHLLNAGYRVSVYTRTKEKAQSLIERGARWADSVETLVRRADVVFTMVGYPQDVEEIYLARNGLIRTCKRGTWLVDLTTSSPQLARDIHEAAEAAGMHALDCPVTGGEEGAVAGTLTLMLGCTQAEAEPLMPLLKTFSAKQMFFDVPGGGQTAKLCNQVTLAANMVGYAEALALAEQAGIGQEKVRELVLSGTGASAAMEKLAPLSMDGDYRARFRSEHLLKDLGLACDAADDLELTLPGTQNARALFSMLCEVGGAKLGTQAISLMYEDEAACVAAGLDWSLLPAEDEKGDNTKEA